MAKLFVMFCVSVLLCSCQQVGEPVSRPHLEQDALEYLVSHADMIAIVSVADSLDSTQAPPFNLRPSEAASIISVLKGAGKPGDRIMILRHPTVLPPKVSRLDLALGNGKHLVFLNASGNQLAPLTDRSVLMVDDGYVTPIWHRAPGAQLRLRRLTLEDSIQDIKRVIERQGQKEKSQGAVG